MITFLKQSPQVLYEKYKFLENSEHKEINYMKYPDGNKLDAIKNGLSSIPLDYYFAAIIPNIGPNLKIVKVFSPNAFPHMNTEIINPNDYKITKLIGINEFPNLKKPLPFP